MATDTDADSPDHLQRLTRWGEHYTNMACATCDVLADMMGDSADEEQKRVLALLRETLEQHRDLIRTSRRERRPKRP